MLANHAWAGGLTQELLPEQQRQDQVVGVIVVVVVGM
jgi:hypothetical protein